MIRGYREHFAESNIQTRLSRKLFQVTCPFSLSPQIFGVDNEMTNIYYSSRRSQMLTANKIMLNTKHVHLTSKK